MPVPLGAGISLPDRTALSSNLARDGVGFADFVSPESSPDWNYGQFGHYDSTTDSGSNLLTALDSKSHMTVVISNGHERLEPSSLSSPGLLLDRHDLQNFVLKRGSNEKINDLMLFDGEREEIDLLQGLDSSILD